MNKFKEFEKDLAEFQGHCDEMLEMGFKPNFSTTEFKMSYIESEDDQELIDFVKNYN